MARIRSIKPSFFTSETIANLADPWARLAFIGLWTHVDDEGRCVDNPKLIRAAIFPLDDFTFETVAGVLHELSRSGLIVRYQHEDHSYIAITNWKEHQVISRPTPSLYPSPSDPGTLTEDSTSTPRRKGREGKGIGKGREKRLVDETSTAVSASGAAERIFDRWRTSVDRPRCTLSPERRRCIVKALKDYPEADLLDAVQGWRNDSWSERPRQNELGILLRDAEQIEKFRDLWRNGEPANQPQMRNGERIVFEKLAAAAQAETENGNRTNAIDTTASSTT